MTALLLVLACQDHAINRVETTDVFLQVPSSAVDILFVIDDSISMENEQIQVAQGFDSFITIIEREIPDFQIGVITTDMDTDNTDKALLIGEPAVLTPDDDYRDDFYDRVKVGTEGSDMERGLSAAMEAMREPRISGHNAGFLRDDAALAIVFVSDENDCSDGDAFPDSADGQACYDRFEELIPVKDFVHGFQALKTDIELTPVFASGIIGPEVAQGCDDSWPGHRYSTVIETLGGVEGNICASDYVPIMGDLAERVTEPLTTFQLSNSAVEDSILVEVDDEVVESDPSTGWTYDAEYWMVRFDGSYVPPFGSEIEITYEIAGTGDQPDTGNGDTAAER